jgi:hypothetical protein
VHRVTGFENSDLFNVTGNLFATQFVTSVNMDVNFATVACS